MRDEHNDRTVVERLDPLVGSLLDKRYRIEFRIAAGGFGAIYRATHVKTGRQVALKVLHNELATSDARVIARFRREGATLAQLRDPHTITAYELGEDPMGPLYIVMELLHGESLYEQFRAHGPLEWQRMANIARMVCSSLAEAHSLGIVHRDLKPANIHLENRDGNPDFVKVLDFGIAKIMRDSDLDSTELTQAGQMIGTFDYMAPEQMVGGHCTARTDIYTLGIVMYEMIAGRRPFADAQSPTAMLASLLTQTPPPLSMFAQVPAALDRVILRCLEREPQNRYADVTTLSLDLELIINGMEDSVTKLVAKTPPPSLHDEVTVIDTRRAKRDSEPHPNIVRRDGSEPRPKRDSEPPHPNVIRREGSAPVVVDPTARAKRDSEQPHPNVIRRDGSQPPFVPAGSQPGLGRREPTPAPAPRPSPLPERTPRPVINPSQLDPRQSQPSLAPFGHAPPIYVQPQYPQSGYPIPPQQPVMDGLGSQPAIERAPMDPASWNAQPGPLVYPTPARGSGLDVQTYDMSGDRNREVVVRRIVWTVAMVLGLILAIVVAAKL